MVGILDWWVEMDVLLPLYLPTSCCLGSALVVALGGVEFVAAGLQGPGLQLLFASLRDDGPPLPARSRPPVQMTGL